MTHRIRYLVLLPFVSALLMMAAIVEATAGEAPVLVRGKFQTPVSLEGVLADWKARGYSDWTSSWKEKGWSSERTYSKNCVRAILAGRMEYIIDGQRFVLDPVTNSSIPRMPRKRRETCPTVFPRCWWPRNRKDGSNGRQAAASSATGQKRAQLM